MYDDWCSRHISRKCLLEPGPDLAFWGWLQAQPLETQRSRSVTALYKQYVRPVMEYACRVWIPDLALTHHNSLQKTQNAALHIVPGCTWSTPVQHLHNECKVLPLRQHMDMSDAQLLAKAEDPAYACHSLLTSRVTARAVQMTPAAYLRGCLESVPLVPRISLWYGISITLMRAVS